MGNRYTPPAKFGYLGRELAFTGAGSRPNTFRYRDDTSNWAGDFHYAKVVAISERSLTLETKSGLRITFRDPPPWAQPGYAVLVAEPRSTPHGLVTDGIWPIKVEHVQERERCSVHTVLGPRAGFAKADDGRDVMVHLDDALDRRVECVEKGDVFDGYVEVNHKNGKLFLNKARLVSRLPRPFRL